MPDTSKKDLAERLGKTELFRELSRRHLEDVAGTLKVVNHSAGHELASEGGGGTGFHLILDGTASVLIGGQQVRKLGPGDYFGEISLIDGGPRSATVRADTPLTTAAMVSWDFRPLLESNPQMALALLRGLCARIRGGQMVAPA